MQTNDRQPEQPRFIQLDMSVAGHDERNETVAPDDPVWFNGYNEPGLTFKTAEEVERGYVARSEVTRTAGLHQPGVPLYKQILFVHADNMTVLKNRWKQLKRYFADGQTYVRVQNLQSRKDLNMTFGQIIAWDDERCAMKFPDGPAVRIKPENLFRVCALEKKNVTVELKDGPFETYRIVILLPEEVLGSHLTQVDKDAILRINFVLQKEMRMKLGRIPIVQTEFTNVRQLMRETFRTNPRAIAAWSLIPGTGETKQFCMNYLRNGSKCRATFVENGAGLKGGGSKCEFSVYCSEACLTADTEKDKQMSYGQFDMRLMSMMRELQEDNPNVQVHVMNSPTATTSAATATDARAARKAERVCGNPNCDEPAPQHMCSQCKQVFYCSKDCQKEHWKKGHRQACVPAAK